MPDPPITQDLVDIVVREFERVRDFYYKKPVVRDRSLLIRPDLVPQRRYGFCVDKSLYLAGFYQVLFTRFAKGRDLEEGLEQEVKEYLQRFNARALRSIPEEKHYARVVRVWYAWGGNFNLPRSIKEDSDISEALGVPTDHFYLQIRYPGTKYWIDVDASWPAYFNTRQFRATRRGWNGRDNTKKTVRFSLVDARGREMKPSHYYLGDTRLNAIIANYPGRSKFHDEFDKWVEEINGVTFEKAMAQSFTSHRTRPTPGTARKSDRPVTY